MKYVKIINKNTIKYGNKKYLKLENKQIFNPTEEDLISNGYFPFIESEIPHIVLKENQSWSPLFILKNNKIIQSWEVIENVSIQS